MQGYATRWLGVNLAHLPFFTSMKVSCPFGTSTNKSTRTRTPPDSIVTSLASVHGHVHWPFLYKWGATVVASNPLGYPGEGLVWDPDSVIEV